MEIVMKWEALGQDQSEETIMIGEDKCPIRSVYLLLYSGRFTMVCLDAFTNRARPVNPLVPMTDDEKALYRMGESLCSR
jgi:acyl-coenzyme A thioesterase 9